MKVMRVTPILNVSSMEESFAWFDKLAQSVNVVITQPPIDFPWNTRECHLRHPDGHTFRVSAGTEEE